jgi:alpha-galactosidase/6-phospho-beta-glucosidase family protein
MSDIAIEVNCATGEVTERPLTEGELAEREAQALLAAEEQAQREQELAAQVAAKQSAQDKLLALGLSDKEVAALLGQ